MQNNPVFGHPASVTMSKEQYQFLRTLARWGNHDSIAAAIRECIDFKRAAEMGREEPFPVIKSSMARKMPVTHKENKNVTHGTTDRAEPIT